MRPALRRSPPSASSRPASAAAGTRSGASFVASTANVRAERRRILGGLLGGEPRRHRVVAALRLDIEPAQAEQPRILTLRHRAERIFRARAVTVELRGLRARSSSASGAPGRLFSAFAAWRCAARASPAPIAISPRETAS